MGASLVMASTRRLCVLIAVLALAVTRAAAVYASNGMEHEATRSTAHVAVDGRVLFLVRGISALPADLRARQIADRIIALAKDPSVTPEMVKVEVEELRHRIVVGDTVIASVVDADAAIEDVRRGVLADANARRIREAIVHFREDRSAASIGRGVATAVLVAAIGAAAWFAVRRMRRLALAFVDLRMRSQVDKLEKGSYRLVRAERIWTIFKTATNAVHIGLLALILSLLIARVLDSFPWTRAIGARLSDFILAPLNDVVIAAVRSLPGLTVLVLIVLITRYVLRWIRTFFDMVGRGEISFRSFEGEWADPTYRLARLVIVAFAVVMAYPYIPGSDSAAFKGVSIFLGVLLSLGSSSVIANIIAGYTMTYRRAFHVGDLVKVGNTVGFVTDMRLMVTYLRSPKNEMITLPNSLILGGEVLNYSELAREQGLILHTTVGIGYETPWRQVEAMLVMAAGRTEGLLKNPPPFVHHRALADFAVTYELNAYCNDATRMVALYTELHRNILDVFNEYGVQIMTPAYEGDPEQPKVVAKDQWYLAPAVPAAAPSPAPAPAPGSS